MMVSEQIPPLKLEYMLYDIHYVFCIKMPRPFNQ